MCYNSFIRNYDPLSAIMIDQEVIMSKEEVIAKIRELVAAPTICPEAKEAGEKYLAAVGTADEKAAARALIEELKEDVGTIDDCLGFYHSDVAPQIFGDALPGQIEAAEKAKAAGEKYCICPACQAGGPVLDNAEVIL